MIIHNIEQRTDEWYRLRAGLPTASAFDQIVTTKGDPSKQAEKYMLRLAGEKIIGMPEETYQNAAMARGVELEAEARLCYELMTGNKVEQVGMCVDERGWGCSPDGLINGDGGLEIKCPSLAVHVGYLLDNKCPTAYWQQVQGNMLVTGRKWWDFMSYYNAGIKPFIIRVERDDEFCANMEAELVTFVDRLNDMVKQIQ